MSAASAVSRRSSFSYRARAPKCPLARASNLPALRYSATIYSCIYTNNRRAARACVGATDRSSTTMEQHQPLLAERPQQRPLVEEQQHPTGDGLMQLAIATTFSVAQTGDGSAVAELFIKQEPQEPVPEVAEEPPVDERLFSDEADMDEEMDEQVYEEVSPVVLQRAVSPPCYDDPNEERFQELALFYKEKYQLKDVTVELESCDKIWQTLKLIKDLQGSPCENISPKNLSDSEPKLPGPLPYQPIIGNDNKALPDFRFSVKSKKKLYHCVTCGKEFIDSQHLRQHAIEEHGVFVHPKRIYKARADTISMTTSVKSDTSINELVEPMEVDHDVPLVPTVPKQEESVKPLLPPEIVTENNIASSELKADESQKKVTNAKDKIKIRCVLCKRVCTDIVYHMRGYHKVGCIGSIIAQCETVTESTDNSSIPLTVESIEKGDEVPPEPMKIDLNESLAGAVKRRKRNAPRWTLPKKRYNSNNITAQPINTTTIMRPANKGPYKCNVCLGFYKSAKSFGYHRRVHRKRGETPENFDPSKCRFLNSPLRPIKSGQTIGEPTKNYATAKKEITKSQTAITDYITVQKEIKKCDDEEAVFQDTDMEMNNGTETEQTACHCGRSFRNYHTMYLHKVKCKENSRTNDSDSGIGISIKIKKNKNDSYEVVPRNTPIEDSYKNSRILKESDASSNDSGMVSVDYNNQKIDNSELSKYTKGHSILRIQVAEDDEEVDIEDGDSNHSNFNGNNGTIQTINQAYNALEKIALDSKENTVQNVHNNVISTSNKNNSLIPSLTNLCTQVLSQSSKLQCEETSTYQCQTCSIGFKNKTELIKHAANMNHSVKSTCPCGKKFKNLKFFNIHIRRFHPLLLKCGYCMTNFDRIEKFSEHKCEVTEGKLFIEPILQTQCPDCKELVDIEEPFDKHMKTHNSDTVNPYQCFKCELRFNNSHERRLHFSKEHGLTVCRICGKVVHMDYMSKHEAYHDGLGHPCHPCKKAFTQKNLLKKHIQNTHDPLVSKIVKCIVCAKTMKLKYLQKHMSLHLHIEICKKCNKCYQSNEEKTFEDHIAANHPNDYPTLKCDICNTVFISDKKYEDHIEQGNCKSANGVSTLEQDVVANS